MQAVRQRVQIHAAENVIAHRRFKEAINDLAHLFVAAVGDIENLHAVAALSHLVGVLLLLFVDRVERVIKFLDECAVGRIEANRHITLDAVHGVLLNAGIKIQFHVLFPP